MAKPKRRSDAANVVAAEPAPSAPKRRRVVKSKKGKASANPSSSADADTAAEAPAPPAHLNTHVILTGSDRADVLRTLAADAATRRISLRVVANGRTSPAEDAALADLGLPVQREPKCFCCLGRDRLKGCWAEAAAAPETVTATLLSPVVDVGDFLAEADGLCDAEHAVVVNCVAEQDLRDGLWCGATVAEWCDAGLQCDDPEEDDTRCVALIRHDQAMLSHVVCLRASEGDAPVGATASFAVPHALRMLAPEARLVRYSSRPQVSLLGVPLHLPFAGLLMATGVVARLNGAGGPDTDAAFSYRSPVGKGFDALRLFDLLFNEASVLNGFGVVFHAAGTIGLEDDLVYSYEVKCSGGHWSVSRGAKWADILPSPDAPRFHEVVFFMATRSTTDGTTPLLLSNVVAGRDAVCRLLSGCVEGAAEAHGTSRRTQDPKGYARTLRRWGWRPPKTRAASAAAAAVAAAAADDDGSDAAEEDEECEEEEEEEEGEEEEDEEEDEDDGASSSSSFYDEHTITEDMVGGPGYSVELIKKSSKEYPGVLLDSTGKQVVDLQAWWEEGQRKEGLEASAAAWYARSCELRSRHLADLRGVELNELHYYDVRESRKDFARLFGSPTSAEAKKGGPRRALDLAGGIGRFSKTVLAHHFDAVDLVEGAEQLCDAARKVLDPARYPHLRMRESTVTHAQLQTYSPTAGVRYNVVIVTWVLMFLTDADVVPLMRKARQACAKGGVIFCKENTLDDGLVFAVSCPNSSSNRSARHYRALFAAAGLTVAEETAQQHRPSHNNLHTISRFILRPSNE